MLNLAFKSLYAATSLQRAQEWLDEYYSLPETNARERDLKAKKIMEAERRIADIKREIYNLNQNASID